LDTGKLGARGNSCCSSSAAWRWLQQLTSIALPAAAAAVRRSYSNIAAIAI